MIHDQIGEKINLGYTLVMDNVVVQVSVVGSQACHGFDQVKSYD